MNTLTDQLSRVVSISLVYICVSIFWGYWVFLLCDIDKLLIYLPALVNLGIFLAAVGRDVARRSPEEKQALRDDLNTIKHVIAVPLAWLATLFGAPPGFGSHVSSNSNNNELPR